MRSSYLIGFVALLATACGGGGASVSGPQVPFQFRTTSEVTVSIDVQKHGRPVSGASVTVVDVYGDSSAKDVSTFFEGGSSPEGRCEGMVCIPTAVSRVDVVIHDTESLGPWTDLGLRDRWGPFAPSSRQTVPITHLDGLVINLEDR